MCSVWALRKHTFSSTSPTFSLVKHVSSSRHPVRQQSFLRRPASISKLPYKIWCYFVFTRDWFSHYGKGEHLRFTKMTFTIKSSRIDATDIINVLNELDIYFAAPRLHLCADRYQTQHPLQLSTRYAASG